MSSGAPAGPAWDAPWDRLQPLPRALWLPTLVASAGDAGLRLLHVRQWLADLVDGRLPDAALDCGDAQALAPLRQAVAELGLAGLSRGSAALAEQVLRTLLWHLDRIADLQPRLSRDQAIDEVVASFREAWQQDRADFEKIQALLQGLGDLPNLRWDELRGLLASRGWQEAQRISEHLARMPELAALIRKLGRVEHFPAPRESRAPQPLDAGAQRVLGVRVVETHLPDAPGELRGIRLSDRLERMLGSEAAQLMHPVLHKLWRARRAEGRLLTYDSEAVLYDLRPDPGAPPRQVAAPQVQPLQRGPIVLCLDTSGSMRGAPEHIAKAVALQAMRTAHQEGRGLLLIAFGGPDEVIERELALTREGLAALLELMGQSFDGGTDVQGPIERAIERVHEARWASADLLIVSDGEFGCTPATLDRLDDARETLGLRVQGILVGDRETLGLMQVADDIHWVRDWRRHGDGTPDRHGFSPVHSKSLTALYFPNALDARAARHHGTPRG